MAQPELKITLFEPVEDGYLLAFSASGGILASALQAMRTVDPWDRRWLADERAWWIADDAITQLARRLPGLAERLDQWYRQRDDISEALEGGYWARCAAASADRAAVRYIPPAVLAAYRKLNVRPGASAEAVVSSRRNLARRHHPDAGGADASMATINAAADTVIEWLKQKQRVPTG